MATRGGDVPAALTLFDKADEVYRRLDVPRPALLVNRLELLVSVPLVDEARAAADRAITELKALKNPLGRVRGAVLPRPDRAAGRRPGRGQHVRRRGAPPLPPRAPPAVGGRRPLPGTARGRPARRPDARPSRGVVPCRRRAGRDGLAAARTGGPHRRRPGRRRPRPPRSCPRRVLRRGRAPGCAARPVCASAAGTPKPCAASFPATSAAPPPRLRRGIGLLDEYRVSLGAAELRAPDRPQGQALALEGLRLAMASGVRRARPVVDRDLARRRVAHEVRLPAGRPTPRRRPGLAARRHLRRRIRCPGRANPLRRCG